MNKNLLKSILTLSLVGVLTLTLGACGKQKEVSSLDKIKKEGKLIVGTSADYPPYEFHKSIDGKDTIVGFEIAIAKEIAKDLGVELEIKDMDFDGVLASVPTGKIDLGVAGINPDPERRKSMDFSDIYYKAAQSIIVREEDKDKYSTIDSLTKKKISVQKGTIQEDIAKEQIKNGEIKSLGKVTDLILELKTGKADAILVETPVAKAYVEKNPGIVISAAEVKDDSEGGSAIGIKKGNTELADAVNKTLERLSKENLVEKFIIEANELMD